MTITRRAQHFQRTWREKEREEKNSGEKGDKRAAEEPTQTVQTHRRTLYDESPAIQDYS